MHIASHAYTAQRENTSRFEGSKKELSLKTTTTHSTETIKKMLSEGGPESVLASKGKYSHTRTFAAGRDQRAVLAFSPSTKRVDGFVMNKDQQLVPIKPYDLPKELQQILSSDTFEAFLKDVHARLIPLHNGDCRLIIQQGLKGGVHNAADLYSSRGDIDKIKRTLRTISECEWSGGRRESRIIIKNDSSFPLKLKHTGEKSGYFYTKAKEAFQGSRQTILSGAAGGIFYASTNNGMPFGTKGYISLDVETDGRNYVVVCAFGTGFLIDNAARIEIRAGDGAQDNLGRIEGHGVDATGRVTDMGDLFTDSDRHSGSGTKYFFESCRMFQVSCEFDNEHKAHFVFTFQNK